MLFLSSFIPKADHLIAGSGATKINQSHILTKRAHIAIDEIVI